MSGGGGASAGPRRRGTDGGGCWDVSDWAAGRHLAELRGATAVSGHTQQLLGAMCPPVLIPTCDCAIATEPSPCKPPGSFRRGAKPSRGGGGPGRAWARVVVPRGWGQSPDLRPAARMRAFHPTTFPQSPSRASALWELRSFHAEPAPRA